MNADGSPSGPNLHMPGTSEMAVGMLGPTPIVARVGGVEGIALHATLAQAASLLVLTPLAFVLNKRWAFQV